MSELIEFLRAQLDEDERVALAAKKVRWDHPDDSPWRRAQLTLEAGVPSKPGAMVARFADPQRQLAEVAAKRVIVDEHERAVEAGDNGLYTAYEMGRVDWLEVVLHQLAQPYAGREGWRDEWRVE